MRHSVGSNQTNSCIAKETAERRGPMWTSYVGQRQLGPPNALVQATDPEATGRLRHCRVFCRSKTDSPLFGCVHKLPYFLPCHALVSSCTHRRTVAILLSVDLPVTIAGLIRKQNSIGAGKVIVPASTILFVKQKCSKRWRRLSC